MGVGVVLMAGCVLCFLEASVGFLLTSRSEMGGWTGVRPLNAYLARAFVFLPLCLPLPLSPFR